MVNAATHRPFAPRGWVPRLSALRSLVFEGAEKEPGAPAPRKSGERSRASEIESKMMKPAASDFHVPACREEEASGRRSLRSLAPKFFARDLRAFRQRPQLRPH